MTSRKPRTNFLEDRSFPLFSGLYFSIDIWRNSVRNCILLEEEECLWLFHPRTLFPWLTQEQNWRNFAKRCMQRDEKNYYEEWRKLRCVDRCNPFRPLPSSRARAHSPHPTQRGPLRDRGACWRKNAHTLPTQDPPWPVNGQSLLTISPTTCWPFKPFGG